MNNSLATLALVFVAVLLAFGALVWIGVSASDLAFAKYGL